MTLIKCPECGKDISDKSNSCPHCGYPTPKKEEEWDYYTDDIYSKEVCCPKCGSTQITAVPRKWSPLTGVFTNKVDRVCLNCKKKF